MARERLISNHQPMAQPPEGITRQLGELRAMLDRLARQLPIAAQAGITALVLGRYRPGFVYRRLLER